MFLFEEVYERQESGQRVFDVYVLNDPDVNSVFHAGGMPAKWLVMHCGSANEFRAKFPNSIGANGQPLVKSKPETKPQETDADVPIEMVIDKEAIEEYIAAAKKEIEAQIELEKKSAEQSDAKTELEAAQNKS